MPNAKKLAKNLAKKSIGAVLPSPLALVDVGYRCCQGLLRLIPPSSSRLHGKLAKDGGKPVRNAMLRPWPSYPSAGMFDWTFRLSTTMGRIFRNGAEGLPQPLANEFARTWADYCGAKYSLLLPHGTDALRAALAAALDHDGLDYGGEVIVPNLSFVASATAALDRRFGVAFVDVAADTLNLDPARVEEAIVPGRTRAIMPVHLFGQPADMTALREIAKRYSLALIEDAAQAHGAIHDLGKTGALGDAAAFSFQSFKNLPAGEGGALTTSDPAIFDRAYSFHNAGRSRTKGARWSHESLGWNVRPTEYVAAVLLHRFQNFEAEQALRQARFAELTQRLADVSCVQPLAIGPWVRRHAGHMFVMRYRPELCDGVELNDFLKAVHAEGIPIARAYDQTLTQQLVIQRLAEKRPEYIRILPTPIADQAVQELIFLPHSLFLGSSADLEDVAAAFRKVHAYYTKGQTQVRPLETPRQAQATIASPAPSVTSAKSLRIGVIGVGVMGRSHVEVIAGLRGLSLAGVADQQIESAKKVAAAFGVRSFADADEMFGSNAVDAVVIATPHWQHCELAIAALRAGLHVICEKPLTVTVAQADEVLREAEQRSQLLAVVHQTRFEPVFQHAKKMLASGTLGPIRRCSMVETTWRTQAYYRSSPWRGTWKGEGGGVLLNQAPHLLDRYAWLCGMPATISAFCDTTGHQIEVEDTVSAILRHAAGAHGFIHVNTVEAPPFSQTVISCDHGRLIIEDGKISVSTLADSIREKTANDTRLLGDLPADTRVMSFSKVGSPQELLRPFYENFLEALAGQAALVCPAAEARDAVELANAMVMSSQRNLPVDLPLGRAEYDELLDELMNQGTSRCATTA